MNDMKMIRSFVLAGILTATLASLDAQTVPSGSPATQSPDFSQYKTADDLWAHIEALKQGPATKLTNQDDMVGFIMEMDAAVKDFLKRFPNDPHKWEAKMMEAGISGTLANQFHKQGYDPNEIEDVAREVGASADAPPEIKREARFLLLMGALSKGGKPDLGAGIAAFCKDYPMDPMGILLKLQYGKRILAADPAQAEPLLNEVAASEIPELAVDARTSLQIMKKMLNKPLSLKFTAADGSHVDLANLRGKVVLVDFWATWNAPSMNQLPAIVATYKKYHDKGFEIVGISLDDDKETMLKTTKEKEMTWPQFFDGKGYENKISSSYGINSIPTMWLVNKKGVLVNTEAPGELDPSIEKLLAE